MRYKATATLRALYAVPNICDIDKVEASSINVTKISMHVNKLFANNHLRCFSGEATSIKTAQAKAIYELEHWLRFYLSSKFKSNMTLFYIVTNIRISYSVTWRYRKIK